MERVNVSSDTEKRGKLLLLAGLIAVAMFLNKILQKDISVEIPRIYLNGALYFVISFVGLLWSFNFQVKFKSILYIVQAALFVFSEAIFIEFFFFQKFNRLYEALILLILLTLVFIGNYVAFLMANVFNVGLFKNIPLIHVGRTSSYLISLLTIYFVTFSLLSSNLPIYFLLPIIAVVYAIVVYVHYLNIGIEGGEQIWKTVLTGLVILTLFLGVFLTGNSHEIVSFVPVVGYFLCVSVVSQSDIEYKERNVFFSLISLAGFFLIAIFVNLLG